MNDQILYLNFDIHLTHCIALFHTKNREKRKVRGVNLRPLQNSVKRATLKISKAKIMWNCLEFVQNFQQNITITTLKVQH